MEKHRYRLMHSGSVHPLTFDLSRNDVTRGVIKRRDARERNSGNISRIASGEVKFLHVLGFRLGPQFHVESLRILPTFLYVFRRGGAFKCLGTTNKLMHLDATSILVVCGRFAQHSLEDAVRDAINLRHRLNYAFWLGHKVRPCQNRSQTYS